MNGKSFNKTLTNLIFFYGIFKIAELVFHKGLKEIDSSASPHTRMGSDNWGKSPENIAVKNKYRQLRKHLTMSYTLTSLSNAPVPFNGKVARFLIFVGNTSNENNNIRAKLEQRFGYNFDNLPAAIALAQYLEMVEFIRLILYPIKPVNEAYELIGYQTSLHGYFQGGTGLVLKAAARVLGPQHSAPRFVKALKTILPTGEHDLLEQKTGQVVYRLRGVFVPPALVCGWLKAGIEVSGAKTLAITVQKSGLTEVIYRISYT